MAEHSTSKEGAMPEQEDPKQEPGATPNPTDPKPDALGDAGKKALDAERKARRDAEQALAEVQKKLKDIEDLGKSEVDKLRDEVAKLAKERDDHATRALRLEIATAKGLTVGQAKRLVGTTKEELEADAEELLADFTPANPGGTETKPTPGSRPKERLLGGGDPTEQPEETDPRKLADLIPRR
jgi:hypothetical protein